MECCAFIQTEPIGSRSNFYSFMTHTSFSSSKGVSSVLSALGAVATGLRSIPFGGFVAPHRGAMEAMGGGEECYGKRSSLGITPFVFHVSFVPSLVKEGKPREAGRGDLKGITKNTQ